MDVLPIQSLPIVTAAVPASSRAEFATTRAIDFRPHEQGTDRNPGQQDSTYTPSGGADADGEHQPQPEIQARGFLPGSPVDEPPSESTISLFA